MIIEMPEIGSKYIQYPDCFLQTVLSHQVKEFNSLPKTRNTGLFLFSQKINDFSIWVAKWAKSQNNDFHKQNTHYFSFIS